MKLSFELFKVVKTGWELFNIIKLSSNYVLLHKVCFLFHLIWIFYYSKAFKETEYKFYELEWELLWSFNLSCDLKGILCQYYDWNIGVIFCEHDRWFKQ